MKALLTEDLYTDAKNSAAGWSASLSPQELQTLAERHGFEAKALIQEFPEANYWQLEAIHALRHTMCLHLSDFLTRRVPAFLSHQDHGVKELDSLEKIFRETLSWSADQWLEEKMAYLAQVEREQKRLQRTNV